MNDYDYSSFSDCSNLQRANLIRGGVNVLLDKDNLVSSEPTTQTDEMVTLFLWMPFLPRREKSLWKKANACHRLLRFAAVCSPLQNVLKKHILKLYGHCSCAFRETIKLPVKL